MAPRPFSNSTFLCMLLLLILAFCQISSQGTEFCEVNLCKNNGTCYVGLNTTYCKCSFGYEGKQCEIDGKFYVSFDKLYCNDFTLHKVKIIYSIFKVAQQGGILGVPPNNV